MFIKVIGVNHVPALSLFPRVQVTVNQIRLVLVLC